MAMSWHTMMEFEPPLVGCVITLATDDPLASLQRLAQAWRRELGARTRDLRVAPGEMQRQVVGDLVERDGVDLERARELDQRVAGLSM